MQDAFLLTFHAIDRFEAQARLSTWLHPITVNAALMKPRTPRRKAEESIVEMLTTFQDDSHRTNPGPKERQPTEESLRRKETGALVRACIDQLPDNYRSVLLLHDSETRATVETARLLELSPNAVKIRPHRARHA